MIDSPAIVAFMFQQLDTDGSGYIDAGELRHLFSLLGMVDYDDDDFVALETRLLAQFDTNADERLDFTEFSKLLIYARNAMSERSDDAHRSRDRLALRGSARVKARRVMADADLRVSRTDLVRYVEKVAGGEKAPETNRTLSYSTIVYLPSGTLRIGYHHV